MEHPRRCFAVSLHQRWKRRPKSSRDLSSRYERVHVQTLVFVTKVSVRRSAFSRGWQHIVGWCLLFQFQQCGEFAKTVDVYMLSSDPLFTICRVLPDFLQTSCLCVILASQCSLVIVTPCDISCAQPFHDDSRKDLSSTHCNRNSCCFCQCTRCVFCDHPDITRTNLSNLLRNLR